MKSILSSLVLVLLLACATHRVTATPGIFVASGVLTPEEITGLYVTPVEVISAPGSGYRAQIIFASLGRFAGQNTEIVGGGGGDGAASFLFQYGNTALGLGVPAVMPPTWPSGQSFPLFADAPLLEPTGTNYIAVLSGAYCNPDVASDNTAIFAATQAAFNAEFATADTKYSIVYAIIPV